MPEAKCPRCGERLPSPDAKCTFCGEGPEPGSALCCSAALSGLLLVVLVACTAWFLSEGMWTMGFVVALLALGALAIIGQLLRRTD